MAPDDSTAGEILLIAEPVPLSDLRELAERGFGDMVKAVVDIDRGIMAVGGELHADEETALLDAGSNQQVLWGINLYPATHGAEGWIEFDSLINIRPKVGNRSRGVEDEAVRARIIALVDRLVRPVG